MRGRMVATVRMIFPPSLVDAEAAAQRRVGAVHTQDSLDPRKTLLRIFNNARRRHNEAPMQIDEAITPYDQLASRAARLQRASDVDETAPVIVYLVRETPAQC